MKKLLKITAFIVTTIAIISTITILCLIYSVKSYNLNESKLIKNAVKIEYYDTNDNLFFTEDLGNSKDYIKIEKLSNHTINAFIDIEDKRFFSHNGIDYRRIFGATINNIKSFSFKEGASTISQQLVKNTHLNSEKTLKRKFAEIKITRQLEKKYTKQQILEKYLNTIYFGKGAYGINKASLVYFGKTADKLSISESATLSAIIKAPLLYSPLVNYENALKRRNLVLKCMVDENHLDKSEYEKLIKTPIELACVTENNFTSNYIKAVKSEYEKLNLNPYNVKNNLKIYTHLDLNVQNNLSKILSSNNLNCDKSGIIINNKNNGVIAYFGNNFNLKRSPASTIKPLLIYAPMIEEDFIKESTVVLDKQVTFGNYSPKNYGEKYYGEVTVKQAIEKSLNTVPVKLLNDFGVKKIIPYATKLGIVINEPNLSIALGALDNGMSLKEICDGYSTFANSGIYSNSTFIKKITLNNVNLYENKSNFTKIYSDDTVAIINDTLQSAVQNGTSKKLRHFNFDICAKTGTNGLKTGNLDAYSIAYTTEHTFGVWLGNENEKTMPNEITGGSYASAISSEIINAVYQNYKPQNFKIPSTIEKVFIDEKTLFLDKIEVAVSQDKGTPFLYKTKNSPRKKISDTTPEKKADLFYNSDKIKIEYFIENAIKCEIIEYFNGIKTVVYNGDSKGTFEKKLKNFGKYEYKITATFKDKKNETITLKKIIHSQKITKSNWWEL